MTLKDQTCYLISNSEAADCHAECCCSYSFLPSAIMTRRTVIQVQKVEMLFFYVLVQSFANIMIWYGGDV